MPDGRLERLSYLGAGILAVVAAVLTISGLGPVAVAGALVPDTLVTQTWGALPGAGDLVTQTWGALLGAGGLVTQTWGALPGAGDLVTQTWGALPGAGDLVTQTWG